MTALSVTLGFMFEQLRFPLQFISPALPSSSDFLDEQKTSLREPQAA